MNLGQAMNTWGAMYRMTGDKSYIEAGKAGWEKVMRYHGQASGVFTGDETLSGTPPARGTETCTVGACMLNALLTNPLSTRRLLPLVSKSLSTSSSLGGTVP